MSKGSNRRPTNEEAYGRNLEAIFGKKESPMIYNGIEIHTEQHAQYMQHIGGGKYIVTKEPVSEYSPTFNKMAEIIREHESSEQ